MKPQQPHEGKKTPVEPESLEKLESTDRLQSIGLPLALTISIGIALMLTAISIGLYLSSNLSRIDLSKPKYADIRQDVLDGGNEQEDGSFDRDSPITKESITEAVKEMKKRREDLRQLGGFDTSILDDGPLGIGTSN